MEENPPLKKGARGGFEFDFSRRHRLNFFNELQKHHTRLSYKLRQLRVISCRSWSQPSARFSYSSVVTPFSGYQRSNPDTFAALP
jgi:hypothetical protein